MSDDLYAGARRGDLDALAILTTSRDYYGRHTMIIPLARKMTRLYPDNAKAWQTLGDCLATPGHHFDEALAAFERSLALAPGVFGAVLGFAICCYSLGRFESAVAACDDALKTRPGNRIARRYRALSLLGAGRFTGFLEIPRGPLAFPDIQEWRGEDIAGKTIAVLHEEGHGDAIQFCRYIPLLKQRGARVVVSAPADLNTLFRLAGLADEYCDEGTAVVADVKCPMLALPAHFGTEIDGSPYLVAPSPAHVLSGPKKKVGVVWAGINDSSCLQKRFRSTSVWHTLPLFDRDDCDFYSLQTGAAAQLMREACFEAFMTDLSPHTSASLSDTAAIVAQLDAVVSADVAAAHIAGALGKRVYLMLSATCVSWRWFDYASTTTPWYRNTRLYRQKIQHRWRPVVDAIRDDL